MSYKASSTGIPTWFTNATDLYGSHATWMLPVIHWFEGTPINLTGGRFTTGTGLSASMFCFLNRTTGWCSTPYFTISEYSDKEFSVDTLYKSLFLHYSVSLFYCDSMSHSHIILSSQFHIKNWYCNSLANHLCTTWVTLYSDSNIFQSTTIWIYHEFWSLQVISKLSYTPPYCGCLSHKDMYWLFHCQHCWYWDEINWP